MGTLEKMGQIDCIVMEKQGSLTKQDEMKIASFFVFGEKNLENSSEESHSFSDSDSEE